MLFKQINPKSRRFSLPAGWFLLLFLVLLPFLSGCRQSAVNIEGPAVIELIGPVVDPAVGPGMVLLRVTDAAGRPLDDVSLQLKGDMTHAGMVPVLAESSQGANGLYRLPFEWTMAGDWLLTVEVQLPAGEKMQARFPITVSGEDPGCEVDETPADRSELNASG